jgi:site-specific recombinase XerD
VRELLDDWIKDKRGSTSQATVRVYQGARDSFIAFLGPRADRSIRLLKKSEVVEFRQHLLSEGRTPTTVNNMKLYLTGPFESARKEGWIEFNPIAAVKSLKATTRKRQLQP